MQHKYLTWSIQPESHKLQSSFCTHKADNQNTLALPIFALKQCQLLSNIILWHPSLSQHILIL